MKGKIKKEYLVENKKAYRNKTLWQASHQRYKRQISSFRKILGTILEMDEGRTNMVNFQLLAQFLVDHLYPVVFSLTLFLC